MSQDIIIAFDVMGGDLGPRPCVSAALQFAASYPDTRLVLHGQAPHIHDQLHELVVPSNITVVHADDVVDMNDDPMRALRSRKASSMWSALNSLSDGRVDACVSCGNTGVLMAISRYLVKTLASIKRPAICKLIPTRHGASLLLDLGANINCTAENLHQFALMGCAHAKVMGVQRPRLAMLNIGSELSKGNDQIKTAAEMLSENDGDYTFIGYVEGDELYSGRADVIVCDGLLGNVALKVSEGLVKHLTASLNEFFHGSMLRRLARIVAGPLLRRWSQNKNPSLYNGAAFLGLRRVVIKSHGRADVVGLIKALEVAREQVRLDMPERINAALHTM